MSETDRAEILEEKCHEDVQDISPSIETNDDHHFEEEKEYSDSRGGQRKKSVIDLSLGLEEVSPVKVKRGSVDLSLGLAYQEDEKHAKSSVPNSLLKFGLERQVTDENSLPSDNGGGNGIDGLSPELLELLQSTGESTEAWEGKVDERKSEHHHPAPADLNPSDILSKLGFFGDFGTEGETWETKTTSAHETSGHSHLDSDDPDIEPAKLMGMLGISEGDDAGEAWEKKTHSHEI